MDLGKIVENLEFKQSYFACLNPYSGPTCLRKKPSTTNKGEDDDGFSGGTILCCDSMSETDIERCNQRLLTNKDSFVTSRMKDNMLRLGIDCKGREDEIQVELAEMEKRDKEGLIARKEFTKGLQ